MDAGDESSVEEETLSLSLVDGGRFDARMPVA